MHTNRHNSGFALLLVLITLVVATLLGSGYLYSSSIRMACSDNLTAAVRARYLAESGLQHAMYVAHTNLTSLQASSPQAPLGPYYADSTNDAYRFYLVSTPSAGTYVLEATATCAGIQQKCSATVGVASSGMIKVAQALLAGDNVTTPSTMTVIGNVHTNGSLTNKAVILGNASAVGTITDTSRRITGTKTPNAAAVPMPLFIWSDLQTYNINGTKYTAVTTSPISAFGPASPQASNAITGTNPGGVIVLTPSNGQSVTLSANLNFHGTLVINGNLIVGGTGITLNAVSGFPALVVNGQVILNKKCAVTIYGLVKAEQGIAGATSNGRVTWTMTGGMVLPVSDLVMKGTQTVTYDANRCTVYDFKNKDGAGAVSVGSWND